MARKNISPVLPSDLSVAYHDGPPQIAFCGRDWRRGVPQTLTAVEWARMQLRGDFGEFGFKTHPHPNPPSDGEGNFSKEE